MEPAFQDDWVSIYNGDCLEVMREMEPDSIDAIVTDPPYGLEFMGKEWDHGVPGEHFWHEALRVAKPGAHLVAFGGTRTHHRLMCAIEDAGWEIRDCLGWLYGSGFPKSLDVSKAIDKAAGAEREVVTTPATPEAAAWNGWGTALKPAWEPIVLARKPFTATVAANVQQYGTGALNIDGCKIDTHTPRPLREVHALRSGVEYEPHALSGRVDGSLGSSKAVGTTTLGRWPANIVHDGGDEVLALLGEKSRFFYTAKASKSERNEGLHDHRNTHPTVKPLDLMRWLVRLITPPDGVVLDPFMGSGTTLKAACAEGHRSIGIDIESEHCEIAWGRLSQGVLL